MRLLQPVLAWVPLVTHIQLLLVLWLQLPIVRATARLLALMLPPIRSSSNRVIEADEDARSAAAS